jgi:ABC-type iron transport system FetAB permease component
MPLSQKIFALSLALLFVVIVIDLARRKRLRVEYSILWSVTAAVILLIVVWYDPLVKFTKLVGAVLPTTILFIFSIMFLLFLNLHFSVKVSDLSEQLKNLGQEFGIDRAERLRKDESRSRDLT